MASVHTILPAAACEKLAEDAAQTTLMVMEFQRWYREQHQAVNFRQRMTSTYNLIEQLSTE